MRIQVAELRPACYVTLDKSCNCFRPKCSQLKNKNEIPALQDPQVCCKYEVGLFMEKLLHGIKSIRQYYHLPELL